MKFGMGRGPRGEHSGRGRDFSGWGSDERQGGGRMGGRGGNLGRLFAHGNLHLAVLHLIAEKPRHGYEIIKTIEEMVSGSYSPSPGTVYPALSMLEDQGFVTVETVEGNKKLYTVTDAGKAYLAENQSSVTALLERMTQMSRQQGGEPPAQIVRAVENLKTALRLRLSKTPLTEEASRAIVDALDRTAKDIDRS